MSKILEFVEKWMQLEIMIADKIDQTQMNKYHMFSP